jgi:organic hydroperoxide reductase OsmC/OhrA
MKVEHVASSSSSCFYKRLVRVLAYEKINVIDVKYSTTALKTEDEDDEPIQYSALVLFEDKKEDIH